MSTPRRWARRAVLALAGSGLTAAGLGGTFAGGALGAEAPASTTGASESPPPPVTETSPQAPAPAQGGVDPSTTTSTTPPPSSESTAPASSSTAPSGTSTAPSAPAADTQQAPTVVVQRSQQTTSGRRRGASVTGSGKGGTTGGGQGGSGSGEGAAQSAPGTVPAGTPNGVAPAPQAAGGEPNPAQPTLATLLSGSAVSAQALDFYRIPLFLLPVYQAAAFQYDVPWQVLAAINEVETDYGTDLSVSTAGAVGWMQFMPATWLRYGVDATSAGYADPYNPVDAIFAAARYLHAAGASHDLRVAILAYNHSQEYVESVLLRARLIASYPRSVIATLTGLVDGRAPTAGARLAPGMGTGLAAEPTSAALSGSPSSSPSSSATGSSAAGGPFECHRGRGARGDSPGATHRRSAGGRDRVGSPGLARRERCISRHGRSGWGSGWGSRIKAPAPAAGCGGPRAGGRKRSRQEIPAERDPRRSRRPGGGGGGRADRAPRALPRAGALSRAAGHLRGCFHLRRTWQHRSPLPPDRSV